ncbi:VOC family protein [Congregibacter sp.]|uniref:VOC family protein n=1 Tax=Congregibacter sp. TaxID=2744308 RepID=UPI00385C4F0B
MLGYVTLGSNQFEKAAAFYDALFAECGAKRLMELDGFILWGTSMEAGAIALTKPFNQEPATVGNGGMAAIQAESKEVVDALHRKALEAGGQDEGEPGQRGDGFYASYFRDLDGNKLAAFFLG